MKFLVIFDLEFDLKFEISDGNNLVKFGGRTFLPARKARESSGGKHGKFRGELWGKFRSKPQALQISRLFLETSFSRRQKGGASRMPQSLLFIRKKKKRVLGDLSGVFWGLDEGAEKVSCGDVLTGGAVFGMP